MTSRLAAVCCLLLSAVITYAQAPPRPPSGTGLIVGQVVDAATGRGVPDVAVTPAVATKIASDGSVVNSQAVLSDRDGRFVLRGLAPGDYLLAARRSGYVQGF